MSRHGSLFSGAGTMDLAALSALGGSVAWFAEHDPAASAVLAHHWPGVPNHGDVTTVDWSAVEPVNVLTAGFPCQDVSSAGKRAGMRPSTRSGLWSHTAYAISRLRPELVVIENVRGLLSADAHCDLEPCPWCLGDDEGRPLRALGGVLGDLASLGYDARWCGLRTADVGAPHGRFRVFIAARPTDAKGDSGWLGDGDGRSAPDTNGEVRRGLADPPEWSEVGGVAVDRRREGDRRGRFAANPDSAGRGQGCGLGRRAGTAVVRDGASAPTDTASGGDPYEPIGGDETGQPVGSVAGSGAGDRPGGATEGVHELGGDASVVAWGVYAPAVRHWELILGRPAPAPTQAGRRGGQQLSPPFVEWLMGWPQGWVTDVPGLSRNDQLKIAGNGVVPQQAAAAIAHLSGLLADSGRWAA